nr:MAG TPA: hypothetical protein [Caudoviricetes sp.]
MDTSFRKITQWIIYIKRIRRQEELCKAEL